MTSLLLIGLAATVPSSPLWEAPSTLSMDLTGYPTLDVQPPALARWVRERLADYEMFPAKCQARLDGAKMLVDGIVELARRQERSAYVSETAELRAETAERWSTWVLVLGVGAGVVLGAAVMWLAAQVAP